MPNPNDRDDFYAKDDNGDVHRVNSRGRSRFTRRAEAPKDRAVQQANKLAPARPLDLDYRAEHMRVYMAEPKGENGLRPDYEQHYELWRKTQR